MMTKTPKQIFLDEVGRLFQLYEVDSIARGVYSTMKSGETKKSRTSSKSNGEAKRVAILEVLKASAEPMSREDIAEAVGEITPNSVSAYASQLINSGQVVRSTQRYAKGRSQVVYACV